jgi:hypothetical protein
LIHEAEGEILAEENLDMGRKFKQALEHLSKYHESPEFLAFCGTFREKGVIYYTSPELLKILKSSFSLLEKVFQEDTPHVVQLRRPAWEINLLARL